MAYKINKPVLYFINKYNEDLDIVMKESKYNEILNTNKLKPIDRLSILSKYNLHNNILRLADIYKNIPEFFIPVRIDNRGRVYCDVNYLNYQSSDLAKSLILFSESVKVDKHNQSAIEYLKIYGVNCYGNKMDKKSYNLRLEWFHNKARGHKRI